MSSTFKFETEYIHSEDYPNGFLLENHLLCITSKDNEILSCIYESLTKEETKEFVKLYVTNGAINLYDLTENIALF